MLSKTKERKGRSKALYQALDNKRKRRGKKEDLKKNGLNDFGLGIKKFLLF